MLACSAFGAEEHIDCSAQLSPLEHLQPFPYTSLTFEGKFEQKVILADSDGEFQFPHVWESFREKCSPIMIFLRYGDNKMKNESKSN